MKQHKQVITELIPCFCINGILHAGDSVSGDITIDHHQLGSVEVGIALIIINTWKVARVIILFDSK